MSRPLVSINTCTYNSSRFIGETLRSVFAQTLHDFELVIVDDGSTDGTPELIEAVNDPRIKLVRQSHITLRFARTIALAHSDGEYLAFLDSDDLWYPEKLERQVAMARQSAEPALLFCDAELIDANASRIGRFSDQFAYAEMNLRGINGYAELLRRGNFIASPTPFVLTEAIRDAGGFNHSYRHVNDFDLWLRLARRHPLRYLAEPLALYRVHDAQFTRSRMDITLPEQRALLDPIINSCTFPVEIRTALGDNMLGQHRLAATTLRSQGRPIHALRATLGMLRYPERLVDSLRHEWRGRLSGKILESALNNGRTAIDAAATIRANAMNLLRQAVVRGRRLPGRLRRMLTGGTAPPPQAPADPHAHHVWIDGTCLSKEQTGYFNLLAELIRQLAGRPDCVLHITTNRRGETALRSRMPAESERLHFHQCGWRVMHWSEIHHRVTRSSGDGVTARLIRAAWRWWPRPRHRTPTPNSIEVLFWRGRYRFRDAHRVAIVQDMTTRLHPEWHTPGNVREFDEFLRYAQQHSHAFVTVSRSSRNDILDRVAVPPDSVSVLPMPIHPAFHAPVFSRGWLTLHRVTTPYVLCVGTIEPRKNLRRLVKAFEWLRETDALRNHTLVLIGPSGWDPGFHEFLAASDVASRVIALGFVPTDHLPSLYHFASAVVQPSLYEGFGIPVMEAMCSSAVVIASNRGSLPEVLGEGVTFDPTDSRAIAAALMQAVAMAPEDAAAYRRSCRRRAEAHLQRAQDEPLIPGLPPGAPGAARVTITFALPFINLTGGIRVMLDYANWLHDAGHDVTVVYPRWPYQFQYTRQQQWIEFKKHLRHTNEVPWFDLRARLRCVPVLRTMFLPKADVVIAAGWAVAHDVAALSASRGRKVLILFHHESGTGSEDRIRAVYALPFYRIAFSDFVAQSLVRRFGCRADDVVPNGVDPKLFYPDGTAESNSVLFLYHPDPRKGGDLGLEVLAKLREVSPGLTIRICGTVRPAQVPPGLSFEFHPADATLRRYFSQSTALLYPSRDEGFGLPPLEAMACGCPSVSTAVGAVPEYAVDDVNATVVRVGDVEAMVNGVRRYIADADRRRAHSLAGLSTAERYAINRVAPLFADALMRAAAQ